MTRLTGFSIMTAARGLRRAAVVGGALAVTVIATAGAASAGIDVSPNLDETGTGLTVLETLALYVGAPVAVFALITLVVLGPSMGKGGRPGRPGSITETRPIWVDADGVQRTPADTVVPDGPGAGRATEPGGSNTRS